MTTAYSGGPAASYVPFTRADIDQSIPARFASQVRRYPGRLAVKTAAHSLTYEALQQAAQRVAQAILAVRAPGEEPIALLLDLDAPLIAAILGVLGAGKMYVPLDPRFPRARIAAMLEDSQAPVIVTSSKHLGVAAALAQHGEPVLNLDELPTAPPVEVLDVALSSASLACIIYTSGSTGRPKGVVHSHGNVLHAIANYTNLVHVSADDRLSLLYSCGAIGAVRDTFSALLNGATLCPFDVKERGLHELADWLGREEITVYNSATTLFRQLGGVLPSSQRFPHLRLVKFGGEGSTRRDVELFRRLCSPGSFLFIGLSTTETGGSVRAFLVDHATPLTWSVPPIGYAVDGIETLLLGEDGQPVERDGIGEIAVKSRHLAIGYWHQPDLTRTAFLPDPAGSDARIYRTGDVGRLLPDGCLEYLGRKDFQVKVRGNRVETAEVELALLEQGTLKEAVVVAQPQGTDSARLVAYVVPSTLAVPPVIELRRFLTQKLPEYMVPSTFVVLDALPLSPNGKLDRLALPAPPNARPALSYPYADPRTPIETELARLWAQVLDLEQVGVHDNFLDLGGHSLSAIQIVARVRDTWHVDIPLRSLLEASTVADMALAVVRHMASDTGPDVLD